MPKAAFFAATITILASLPVSGPAQTRGVIPQCIRGCFTYSVSVTPHGGTAPNVPAYTNGYSADFTVTNTGSAADNYNISCFGTTNVTCTGTTAGQISLNAGASTLVTAYYSVGDPGAGTISLTASSLSQDASDVGTYTFTVTGPKITIVAPVTSGNRAVVSNRQPLVRALFQPTGGLTLDTTGTVLKWRGGVVTSFARTNRGLLEWAVDSTRQLAIGDSALMEVTACLTGGPCVTRTAWVVLLNDLRPVLGFTGVPLEALGRQFNSSFGPWLYVTGGELESSIGTLPYFSMGAARSAGLVYSTRQSYPRALVPVDLELTWPAGTPDLIKLILFDGATQLDSVVLASPTCATNSARTCRAVLQGDFSAASFSTPTRKWLTVQVQVTSGQTTQMANDSVEVVLVDRRSTSYGSGWWPAGFSKLVGAGSDRLLIAPNGAATVYRGNGDSLYLSPPGDFTTLVKTSTGWELRPRGSPARIRFDTNGRLAAAADQNGNRDSIVYNGTSDQITALVDPVGNTITIGYDGNGKVSTFTDPGGRQTRVGVTVSFLTYDSIPSDPTRPYTTRFVYQQYPGTNTLVLTQRIGVIADTAVVTYDSTFFRRPSQVTLPQVQDETGANVKPVIAYTAYEAQGYHAVRSLDSVYVEMKDARNNWTRSLINRWGEARKTWDAIGLIGQAQYAAEGFVLWAEGKVADSSRIYHTYDAVGRLARTYIIRATNDTLRLDSLVYDANHRVVTEIDARGKATQFAYDANGSITSAITPHNDTTRAWYRSDGLPDSTRAPGDTFSTRFSYDATWKNRFRVRGMNGETLDSVLYDYLGRDSIGMSKTRVQVGTGSTQWQWRRRLPFYTIANQLDSSRIERTDNCADPCTSPPAWPAASDTVRTQRVGYRFDRAGRDSLRLNDRRKMVRYLYDRLGRLLSRHPWLPDSTGAALRDSLVYDIAGNVKRRITRRGDTLTTNYDSRNRDTLSVIPGVGTLRKLFAGPLDQLTRLWYESPVDSIGGVNAELRWRFDQRGRLKADTSYTASQAQATTYSYDTYERPATSVDVLGTWTTRYETSRGMVDTLLTPFGDTVTYMFDVKGRGVGPIVRGGGGLDRTPTWGASGSLDFLTNTIPGVGGYTVANWARQDDPDGVHPPLVNSWYDRPGAGATLDTLADSLRYDGWERLTNVLRYHSKIHSYLNLESFTYDRTENITASLGGWIYMYDVTTDRLTSDGSGCTYAYDQPGNLTTRTCGANVWTYQYDALNQLRSARYNGTLIVRFGYDVLGRRVAKRVYSSSTGGTVAYMRFVYHGSNVGFETDSAGTVALRYTWGPAADDLLAIDDGTNHYYVVQDKLHSVRGLVNRDGTWIRSLRYYAYGALDADTASPSAPSWALRYRWTGRELDPETGLYYFRTRYYDPGVRRFVQEDPIGYGGGGNVYAYGNGGPLEGQDPGGTMMDCDATSCATRPAFNNCWTLACTGVGIDPDADLFGGGDPFDVNPDFGPMWGDPWAFLGPLEGAYLSGGAQASALWDRGKQQDHADPSLLCTQTVQGQQITTRTSIAADAREFIDDLAQWGIQAQIGPLSSFRTYEQQEWLHKAYLSGDPHVLYAAYPGQSNHEGGYSLDINNFRGLLPSAQAMVVFIAAAHGFDHPLRTKDAVHFEHMSAPHGHAAIGASIAAAEAASSNIGACR